MRRIPRLERRIGRWSALWQPGWGRRRHEETYGSHRDPYGPSTHAHESWKHTEQLVALGGRRYVRALEIGCSQGAFTFRLAPMCDELLATDISEVAVERARAHVGDQAGVAIERRTLPYDFPDGTFDLVVCSDVLNLWEPGTVDAGLDRAIGRLRPGGVLLLMHYLGVFGQPSAGADVHDRAVTLAGEAELAHTDARHYPDAGPHEQGYLLDVFVRADVDTDAEAEVPTGHGR